MLKLNQYLAIKNSTVMTPLKHSIDPMVDCVFKALLGSPENINLTLNFLNAILQPNIPIEHLEIQNPYNEKEFLTDKLTIVDIKAKDKLGTSYQIEVQLAVFPYLPSRILYTWSQIYQSQLSSGKKFNTLQPVISIWLLGEILLKDSPAFHHHFQMYDPINAIQLTDQCAIHLLELPKWEKKTRNSTAEDQWLCFFHDAKNWDQLPNQLNTPEMRQAMQVLSMFSEKENEYHLYQSRKIALADDATKKQLLEEMECKRKEAELKKEDAERKTEDAERKTEDAERKTEDAERKTEKAERKTKEAERKTEKAECKTEEALKFANKETLQKENAIRLANEEKQQKEKALAEQQRLMALLQKAGINPEKQT